MNYNPPWIDLELVIPLTRKKPRKRRNKRSTEQDVKQADAEQDDAEQEEERRTVEQITSLSADAIKNNFPDLIVKVSKRRLGMKLRNVLRIAAGEVTRV